MLFHAFSAYILLLLTEFGWSRASVSGIFSMVSAKSGIVLFGFGYLCFSRIDSLRDFYLSFALIALGSSLGGFIPISTTITNWFARQRSTALGISMTGMGVGSL